MEVIKEAFVGIAGAVPTGMGPTLLPARSTTLAQRVLRSVKLE